MKVKNICCIGAGFVGGPTMAVIAEKCPDIKITLVDKNKDKIKLWNDNDYKKVPVNEPGLISILKKVRNKNLFFSEDIDSAIVESQIIFLAVNTPTKQKGEGAGFAADLKFIDVCTKNIAKVATDDKIIVEKSTLPVRTAERIKKILNNNNKHGVKFEVISNPEFLAEGTAIKDLYKSDRVLIGGDQTPSGKRAVTELVNIYKRWIPLKKILKVNVWSAELSKLASNAFLAQRISSINSLSSLSKVTDADIDEIAKAVGMDKRIGKHFLKVSPGFGGSCFQKDILNLVYLLRFYGLNEEANYWYGVIRINDNQRKRVSSIINQYFTDKKINKKVGLLGWSFKKNTNDTRESSSIYVAYHLLNQGFEVLIYDPLVDSKKIKEDLIEHNINKKFYDGEGFLKSVHVMNTIDSITKSTKVLAIMTEWDEFKNIQKLSEEIQIFDFRNILEKSKTIFSF
jgi:UDPglucose 6-dehydrogenase